LENSFFRFSNFARNGAQSLGYARPNLCPGESRDPLFSRPGSGSVDPAFAGTTA
jgi:hypothetical protein